MTPARLIHLRKSLGLTQAEGAALVGHDISALQRWESDKSGFARKIPSTVGILFELLADGTIDENDILRARGGI